jgi:peptidoglycan/xylan/chitin deacetylase (PgdA/CDA1 family)
MTLAACSSSVPETTAAGSAALERDVSLDASDLPDRVLSLTFDDGPAPNTVALASYLAQEGIQATFFVIGERAVGKEDVLEKLRALGHLVGNHTFTHTPLTTSADPAGEIAKTDAITARFATDGMFLLRAPQGKWSGGVADRLHAAALDRYVGHIHWTAGGTFSVRTAMDWDCWKSGTSVPECGRGYLNEITTARRGAVLMHDIHDATFDLVKWIVPRLRARGFGFARLDASPAIATALRRAGANPSAVAPPASAPKPPRTIAPASPFDLSFLALRGALASEGIPSGNALCVAVGQGGVDAAMVANAAVYSGQLSLAEAADRSYLNALELHLAHLCD